MHSTKNDLPESRREELVKLLNNRLADSIDLQSQVKQAHWNVKGPFFIGLHKLFDEIYEDVVDYVDDIAERAVELGGSAYGTVRSAAAKSSLNEYPLDIFNGSDHVDALSTALAEYGANIRKAIDEAAELDDVDTSDLFTEISRGVDKWLWFVEAHMQADS